MKWVCVTLLCLSVVGGLVNCTPLELFPEKVLMKEPKQPVGSVLDVPREIVEKIGKMIIGMIPGGNDGEAAVVIEGLKEHLEKAARLKDLENPVGEVKNIPSEKPLGGKLPIDDAASKLPVADDLTKGPKKQEEPAKADLNSEDPEAKSRKRRTATVPATRVVGKPEVESRYKVDNSVYPATPGGFVQGNIDFEVSDMDDFGENGRPVIIYIRRLEKLDLHSKKHEDNCDN